MPSERWYRLPGFCLLALLINYVLLRTVRFVTASIAPPPPREIELTLEPRPTLPVTPPKPELKPKLEPERRKVQIVAKPLPHAPTRSLRLARAPIPVRPRVVKFARRPSPTRIASAVNAAVAPNTTTARTVQNRLNALQTERPAVRRLASGTRDVREPLKTRVIKGAPLAGGGVASAANTSGGRSGANVPDSPTDDIAYNVHTRGARLTGGAPGSGSPGTQLLSPTNNPLKGAILPDDRPIPTAVAAAHQQSGTAGLRALVKPTLLPGGGTPAPGRMPNVYSGVASPDAPTATGSYGGTNAGGEHLAINAPHAPGGGGNPIMSAVNPLAKDAVPDDRPGLGPGVGGGGAGRMHGNGALTKLTGKPGIGGAAVGAGGGGVVTGRGRGQLAEQPDGTGKGTGYGGGGGTGAGRAATDGLPGLRGMKGGPGLPGGNLLAKDAVPDDQPGNGAGAGGGSGSGSGGGTGASTRRRGKPGYGGLARGSGGDALSRVSGHGGLGGIAGSGGNGNARSGRGVGVEEPGPGNAAYGHGRGTAPNGFGATVRAVPFGDAPDLMGVGGLGKALAKRHGGGSLHKIFVLDASASMNQSHKMLKAREILKTVLDTLQPDDTFNIIYFDKDVYKLSDEMVTATDENLKKARAYVDGIKAGDLTNMQAAMEAALAVKGANWICLMSDGEPDVGIENFAELSRFVRDHNTENVHIDTFALGTGDYFLGMKLLHQIADENGGEYNKVNMLLSE